MDRANVRKRRSAQTIPDLAGPSLVLPSLSTGLGTRFFNTMNENKDKLHQVDTSQGTTETKGSVRTRAIQVAVEMRSRGIKPDDVVLFCGPVQFDQTVALLACLFVGVIIAPVNSDLPYDDFKRIIRILKPKMAFCGLRSAQLIDQIWKEKRNICDVFVLKGDSKEYRRFSKCFERKVGNDFKTEKIVQPSNATAFIICTHGSEREPKIVALSHYSIFARYMPLVDDFTRKSEKILSFVTLSWATQVVLTCVCFETQGILILPCPITERGICKIVHDLRIEHLYFSSQLALAIVNNAPILDFDLSCIKDICVCGIPMSAANLKRLKKNFPKAKVRQAYKIVEVGDVACLPDDEDPTSTQNSVGKLYPGVTIRVVDIQTRKILGPNRWGELLVKSPGMMTGYYNVFQRSSRAFTSDFFKTGDVVQYDNDGNLYLRGRVGSLIYKDDQTFFSSEIELVLLNVRAVKEAAVFQVQKDVVACVVLNEGFEVKANDVLRYLADYLPEYKRPTKIKFYESLPRTLHGIVKKYILKESAVCLVREDSFFHSEVVNE